MTRPAAQNGLGFSIKQASAAGARIEQRFLLLPDMPAIYAAWKRLVVKHQVSGAKVYDARLVAVMEVHGVGQLLTFDTSDFARYGIAVLDPAAV